MNRLHRRRSVALLLCLWALLLTGSALASTFTNPLFKSQDPWVTFAGGFYYYSDSNGATVSIRKSTTLTGLAHAPAVRVFTPATSSHNRDLWGPELHFLRNHWYIYYAADDGRNANHRLYVAEAATDDPLGSYTDMGELSEPSDDWAIDPDVFEAHGALYLVWSGTENHTGSFPQNIYIAAMSDPLHVSGAKHRISTPTERWEKRSAPINEGPVGFERDGRVYVTFSTSASWTVDYAVGLLTNADGNLLNPDSWSKTGPIFDHHGTAYGPGSVVFVPSPDGTEMWNMYHGIDSPACQPSYACRDIRLQKLTWDVDGSPLLGYPVNPKVPLDAPAGEDRTVSQQAAADSQGWGDAFGDAAEGTSRGQKSGDWTILGPSSASSASLGTGRRSLFRGNPNLEDYTVSADVQWVQTGTTASHPRYGIYACYNDADNQVTALIDRGAMLLATDGIVVGADQGWQNTPLAPGFDPALPHHLAVVKAGSQFTFFLDGRLMQERTFNLMDGQIGLVTEDTKANYTHVSVTRQPAL
jgi:GH43 family beta-xylosidase